MWNNDLRTKIKFKLFSIIVLARSWKSAANSPLSPLNFGQTPFLKLSTPWYIWGMGGETMKTPENVDICFFEIVDSYYENFIFGRETLSPPSFKLSLPDDLLFVS